MKLIVRPRDGMKPLVQAVTMAKRSIWIAVFRFDLSDMEAALEAAIKRGVAVQALIAHTSGGGEKQLRKLESRLLEAGASVARTADDMVRYYGKLLLVDNETLFVLGSTTRATISGAAVSAWSPRTRRLSAKPDGC